MKLWLMYDTLILLRDLFTFAPYYRSPYYSQHNVKDKELKSWRHTLTNSERFLNPQRKKCINYAVPSDHNINMIITAYNKHYCCC